MVFPGGSCQSDPSDGFTILSMANQNSHTEDPHYPHSPTCTVDSRHHQHELKFDKPNLVPAGPAVDVMVKYSAHLMYTLNG